MGLRTEKAVQEISIQQSLFRFSLNHLKGYKHLGAKKVISTGLFLNIFLISEPPSKTSGISGSQNSGFLQDIYYYYLLLSSSVTSLQAMS